MLASTSKKVLKQDSLGWRVGWDEIHRFISGEMDEEESKRGNFDVGVRWEEVGEGKGVDE